VAVREGSPLRIFMSAGEASGELLGAELLAAIRAEAGIVTVDAIGGPRLEAAGARIVERNEGWATIGPLEALKVIPRLLAVVTRTAARLRRGRYDLIVLIDFGAFNLRLARLARALGSRTPILYYFPPAAWLDDERRARTVCALTEPLTAFAHQRDFYRELGLPIGYVGHPLVSTIAPRAARPLAPPDGGHVALLPGSRAGEIARHAPRLLDAFALLRERRPALTGAFAAIDDAVAALIEEQLRLRSPQPIAIERVAREVLSNCDAAAVASGTAVLEAALLEVPTTAFYVLDARTAALARRVYRGRFITLPNLVLDAPVVPELLQEAATPSALADALDAALRAPDPQLDAFRRLRAALGPPDALRRCARFALATAGR
jgi:lipid-A-disaccharide synthase